MWNDQRVEELKKLWREDALSAAEIANRLGATSRNAVIGKARRLGLAFKGNLASPGNHFLGKLKDKKNAKASRHIERALGIPASKPHAFTKPAPPPPPNPAPVPYVEPIPPADDVARVLSVLDLEAHHCRWAVSHAGGMGFCGCQKAEGKSYCAGHVARATDRRPPAPRPYYTHPSAKIFA